jgi:ABC-type glycerol-3-phosphate transport system permease component
VLAFHEYIFAFVTLRDSAWQTVPVGLASMQAGDVYQWPLISAAAVVVSIMCCTFLVAFGRTLSRAVEEIVDRVA